MCLTSALPSPWERPALRTTSERNRALDPNTSRPTIPSGASAEPHAKKCSRCAALRSSAGRSEPRSNSTMIGSEGLGQKASDCVSMLVLYAILLERLALFVFGVGAHVASHVPPDSAQQFSVR